MANALGLAVLVVCQREIYSEGVFDRSWNTDAVSELPDLDTDSPAIHGFLNHIGDWAARSHPVFAVAGQADDGGAELSAPVGQHEGVPLLLKQRVRDGPESLQPTAHDALVDPERLGGEFDLAVVGEQGERAEQLDVGAGRVGGQFVSDVLTSTPPALLHRVVGG